MVKWTCFAFVLIGGFAFGKCMVVAMVSGRGLAVYWLKVLLTFFFDLFFFFFDVLRLLLFV